MPVHNKNNAEQKWTAQLFCRARYAEETLEKAILQGVKQYVILGAGLDTFAFRRPDLLEKLEVFEVDYQATQDFKLHRLAELGWEIPAELHFIPVDFTKENLTIALKRSQE
jgi:methyltransferase (TIGR00027 family)